MRFISNRTFSVLAGLTLLAGGIAAPVLAQTNNANPQPPTGQHHRGGGDNWGAKLNLTDAQKASIKQLRDQERAEMQQVFTSEQQAQMTQARQNHTRPQINLTDTQKQQIQAIHQKYEAQFQSLLTPEQQQQIATFKAQHQGEHHGGANQNGANNPQ